MNLKILLVTLIIILVQPQFAKGNGDSNPVRYTVSGYIKDANDGEILIGSVVYVEELKTGTSANAYGFYSMSLPEGHYTISYSYIGYQTQKKTLDLNSDVSLNIDLVLEQRSIGEVVITGEKADASLKKAEMSVNKLDVLTIRKIPALMGEVDLIKVIQLLPGVQPTSEGTSGFSVRGGGNDQNLVILDEATVYNASHLMGFFSVFNNDAIRDVKLYKGDIPANYGGRLSSVLDVRMKEGNNKKISLTGGIGLISSRLTVEGPIVNEKTSFLISGRRSYADLFFVLSSDSGLKNSTMYFYDLNLKLNHKLNENNRFYLSAYLGRDNFGQKGISDFGFGNQTVTLRWNHLYSKKLFSNLSVIRAKYDYALSSDASSANYVWNSGLLDYTLKMDFNYFPNPGNEIKFGASTIYHDILPCDAWVENEEGKITVPFPKNYEMEYAFYISNEQKLGEKLTLKYGLRYSIFQNMGKTTVYKFDSGYEVYDTLNYGSGEIFHTYHGFEPRFGLNYILNERSSVKASYSRTLQYMQLASNSNGGMPLDVWFPASPNVKPQKANQYSMGYFRNFRENIIETSIEVFYKKMYDVIDFKDHAELLMNPRMEGEIRIGDAEAYGAEFLVRKNEGKISGWISYTFSKSTRQIPGINNGHTYNSPYDKPHTINVVLNYKVSKRSQFAVSWVYATGAPMTAPVGSFNYGNSVNKIYADRNGFRMRDYHRLDLSYILEGKEKPGRKWQGEWNFSVYNAYGRHNDWIINFSSDKNDASRVVAERWYLPFVFFPSITYNFKY